LEPWIAPIIRSCVNSYHLAPARHSGLIRYLLSSISITWLATPSVGSWVQGSDVGDVVGHKGSLGVAVQSIAGCDCVNEDVGRFATVGEGRVKLMAGLSIHGGLGIAVGIIVSLE
jgi:hypothetical protein